ncbi:hypothetical protein EPN42_01480 [bacterium]|nr:MAG: hypothetical protein EPN42_01480 [bacterium]
MDRRGFLAAAGSGLAIVSSPLPARAVVSLVYDPIAAKLQTEQILQKNVANKIALANDLNALRMAYAMIFDHENFIQSVWPAIGQNLNLIANRWGNVKLLNLAGSDLLNALSASYPAYIDTSGMLRDVMGRLQEQGINQVAQWIGLIRADHALANKELQRANDNTKLAAVAKSAKDLMQAQINVTSAGVSIAGAQADGIQLLNTQIGALVNATEGRQAQDVASAEGSAALIFGAPTQGTYHSAPTAPVTDQSVRQAADAALNVPILQPAARAAYQSRTRP